MDAFAICERVGIEHPSRLTWDEYLDWRAYYLACDLPAGGQLTADEVRESMRAVQSQHESAN